ncbi:Uncharacterized protein OBRU01_09091 [Operophtera brumata]|uniref:Uncharacterized protein n=1 Tax=Operophtera brumata TaxID=104452 RepID=A0A0L7KWV6_OPEBR|nr:Uncharacterized protein OBRU01_15802 [Operophtera brumata]KOB74342.1 Uncharacterized protein OBRU01_09091 [Operophtera brumata]
MDLFAKLASNMEEMAGTFESRMLHMESGLQKLTGTEQPPHKDLESLSREFVDFKTFVWKSMAMMKAQLELLVLGLDRQETASRRKVLLFHGIAESPEMAVGDTILRLLADQFKMADITPEQLAVCHRLGTNTSKPRPILVRFANFAFRNVVWNSKTALKNTGITVSEFLTKSRHDVFTAARGHFGMRHCWTSEGKIVILLPEGKRRRIESMSELKPLLLEFPAVQSAQDKMAPFRAQDKGKTSNIPATKAGGTTKAAEARSRRAAK